MVTIVLVAHSRPLGTALESFSRQMAGQEVSIRIAAGSGDDAADFGTNAEEIAEAITTGSPEAVLVLVDLGSAIMSAEMALEMIPEGLRERVRLCPAPFVEGTVAATVQAGLDAPLDEVYNEAVSALQQKVNQIDPEPDAISSSSSRTALSGDAVEDEVRLSNKHGLHARPAAQFVRTASQFTASVTVQNLTTGRGPVSAASISAVATLGAGQDHQLRLSATGAEAQDAVAALRDLVEEGFGEHPTPSTKASDRPPDQASPEGTASDDDADLRGHPVAAGVAVGPAYVHQPTLPELPDRPPEDPEAAWDEFQRALDAVRSALQEEQSATAASGAADAAGILDAQALLLDDEALLDTVHDQLFEERRPLARAWLDAVDAVAAEYEDLDDPYLQQRADDVRDVGRRVVFHLLGAPASKPIDDLDEPSILVTAHLVPSDVLSLPDSVLGVVCAGGNPTSHSAILLRSRGVPTVFDVGDDMLEVANGTPVALNGETGQAWIHPSEAVRETLSERQAHQQERTRHLREAAQSPAETTDGHPIGVEANVNNRFDATAASESGADGIGLLRTEFLFVDRDEPPDPSTQAEEISAVAAALAGKPVTVRALDVGGDKPLPYVPQPHEQNPFLGVRGIRILLRAPDLFRSQLRAVLQVATTHPVRLMLPMVATLSEVRDATALLADVREEMGEPEASASLPLGIMIETPASALSAPRLAEAVDFFSIGTNDLTQYTMAADREHADLTGLCDALHPSVLQFIQHVADVGSATDTPVSLCGELASDPLGVPILVGLGVDRLSVVPPSIPTIKAAIRALSVEETYSLAEAALAAEGAEDVRAHAEAFWEDQAPAFL